MRSNEFLSGPRMCAPFKYQAPPLRYAPALMTQKIDSRRRSYTDRRLAGVAVHCSSGTHCYISVYIVDYLVQPCRYWSCMLNFIYGKHDTPENSPKSTSPRGDSSPLRRKRKDGIFALLWPIAASHRAWCLHSAATSPENHPVQQCQRKKRPVITRPRVY